MDRTNLTSAFHPFLPLGSAAKGCGLSATACSPTEISPPDCSPSDVRRYQTNAMSAIARTAEAWADITIPFVPLRSAAEAPRQGSVGKAPIANRTIALALTGGAGS
jgi:hypothetical protein